MEDNTKEINDEKNTKENKSNNPNNNKKDKNQMVTLYNQYLLL